jgi:hypothetical protein
MQNLDLLSQFIDSTQSTRDLHHRSSFGNLPCIAIHDEFILCGEYRDLRVLQLHDEIVVAILLTAQILVETRILRLQKMQRDDNRELTRRLATNCRNSEFVLIAPPPALCAFRICPAGDCTTFRNGDTVFVTLPFTRFGFNAL